MPQISRLHATKSVRSNGTALLDACASILICSATLDLRAMRTANRRLILRLFTYGNRVFNSRPLTATLVVQDRRTYIRLVVNPFECTGWRDLFHSS